MCFLFSDFQMLELKCEFLNRYIGLCAEPPNVCHLSQYAKHGSLHDVLFDKELELTIDFKMSLASDIAQVKYNFLLPVLLPVFVVFIVCFKMLL